MPPALNRVEEASILLIQASEMLRSDPFSAAARKKLIEGSRGMEDEDVVIYLLLLAIICFIITLSMSHCQMSRCPIVLLQTEYLLKTILAYVLIVIVHQTLDCALVDLQDNHVRLYQQCKATILSIIIMFSK